MSNFKSVDFIVKARHYGGSAKQYILNNQKAFQRKGIPVNVKRIDAPIGTPIEAKIWQGQWIAECECRGASFVDPEQPVFFCFSCGNRMNDGNCRPVIFPPDWEMIERKILERPVSDIAGLTDLERAGMAQAILYVEVEPGKAMPLVRSWEPGETLADLSNQQDEVIRKWHEELKKGKPNGVQ